MTILSAAVLMFMIMDPFGNIPVFMSVLEPFPVKRRRIIILREMFVALLILVAFLFVGPKLLSALQISPSSLRIAGGIVLFLIAIKMVFGGLQQMFQDNLEGEPFIVPLAVPCIAGPSSIATVLLLMGQEPERWSHWLLALSSAWVVNLAILLSATWFAGKFGKRGLCAIERLMGLLLSAIAVEMILQGIKVVFNL
jgi:MarC family membrane protein